MAPETFLGPRRYPSIIHKRLKGVENSHILQADGGRILLGFDDAVTRGSQELELIELMLAQPITVGEHAISLSSCVGAVNKPHVLDFDSMKMCADFAIKQAEECGHANAVILYDDDMYRAAKNCDRIAGILKRAIDQDDFLVFYQPQIDLHKNEVVGYEALVRLKDKVYPPSQFIPVAEVTGLIIDIDRIVTKRSIELLSVWKRRKKRMRPISINFSSVHLTKGDDFASYLLSLLEVNGVPSEYVRIEVNESLFSNGNQQSAEDMVRGLFDAGVSIALDNFGKGCTTFTDIMTIPASIIKIDKEFVDTFLVDGHDQNFEQLVRLAHGLGRKVVVVGVDKEWQIDACRNLNCDIVQGYYFSKPLLPENAVQYKPRA